MAVPTVDYGNLNRMIIRKLEENKLQAVPSFVGKIIQLYETMQVRHGVMVVGSSCIGKTTNSDMLQQSLGELHKEIPDNPNYQVVNKWTLNPKAITMIELYGNFNLLTNEWTDGLIAALVRHGLGITDDTKKWFMFDGPVDAIWIENMNTVLDDNKTLCLANGERIKLPATVSMMFEVNDLAVASPATVSRCGMVYMEQLYIGWQPFLRTWADVVIEPRFAGWGQKLYDLMHPVIDKTLGFLKRDGKEPLATLEIPLVRGFLNLVNSLLQEEYGVSAKNVANHDQLFPLWVAFAFCWSLCGSQAESVRPKLNEFARKEFPELFSLVPEDEGTIFDYIVDVKTLSFVPWTSIVESFVFSSDLPYFNLLVPTVETVSCKYIVKALSLQGNNVLIVGNSGVGKSVVIAQFLDLLPDKFQNSTKNLSAQTSSNMVQAFFEDKLQALRKNLLGPPSGKRMIFFIDDLNMPMKENYGAQPPLELLRQAIGQGGFYDRKKLFLKKVQDTQFLAACGPPGGGRNEISPRIVRHFLTLTFPDLSSSSMRTIFVSICKGYLAQFISTVQSLADPMVDSTIQIYNKIRQDLLPTPTKSHYTFNLRDLSKVFQGVLSVHPAWLKEPKALIKLWTHEACRVFQDRLVDKTDRDWFEALLVEKIRGNFQMDWSAEDFKHVIMGSYHTQGAVDKTYVEMPAHDKTAELLKSYQEDYNIQLNKSTNLVFFDDAVDHVNRICRILRQPRGNALLVGVGGSGRQSLTRLAAFINDYKCFQISLVRGYGVNEFHEDIKQVSLPRPT